MVTLALSEMTHNLPYLYTFRSSFLYSLASQWSHLIMWGAVDRGHWANCRALNDAGRQSSICNVNPRNVVQCWRSEVHNQIIDWVWDIQQGQLARPWKNQITTLISNMPCTPTPPPPWLCDCRAKRTNSKITHEAQTMTVKVVFTFYCFTASTCERARVCGVRKICA